jgi:GGDEF domain-containing protein
MTVLISLLSLTVAMAAGPGACLRRLRRERRTEAALRDAADALALRPDTGQALREAVCSLAGAACAELHPVDADAWHASHFARTPQGWALLHPVATVDAVLATLVVHWERRVDSPSCWEARIVATLAAEAAVAAARRGGAGALLAGGDADPLTGLPDRHGWGRELAVALARARHRGGRLVVAMLNIGRHDSGRALKATAAAWQEQLGASHVLGRLGAGDFAVLLPDCGPEQAARVAGRLHAAAPHPAGCAVAFAAWDGTEDAGALLRRAEDELCEALSARDVLVDPA